MIEMFVLIIFLVVFANMQKRQIEQERVKLEVVQVASCPPHDWSIHPETEKLTCCKCNRVAGS